MTERRGEARAWRAARASRLRAMQRAGAMIMKTGVHALVLAAAAGAMMLGACERSYRRTEGRVPASVSIETSGRDVMVGETATFIARTRDTYGRDADVRWSSTAGELTEEQDGRVARMRFRESGTYTVKATLLVDGREVETAMTEVRVRPVN